jgi:2'-hydroxyisoflavone reductase
MKLLFIGGTRFVGRAMASYALERGHAVTLFNRGAFDPAGVAGAEPIQGDRERDLDRLANGRWDAVIDTCGQLPRIVRASVDALRERVGHYTFISSISVFDHSNPEGEDEYGPVKTVLDELADTFSPEHYGALKARCEQVVLDGFPERALIVRPGLVVGPRDYSDRFTYWVTRIHRGGTVAAPDRRLAPVQWIDVRDLGEWTIRGIEDGLSGVFNATGPQQPVPLGEVLERIARALGAHPEFAWIDTATLEEQGIEPWSDLPLVLPYDGSIDGLARTHVIRAITRGLRYRPLEETARDVLAWWKTLDPHPPLKAGLTAERETALLEAFARR